MIIILNTDTLRLEILLAKNFRPGAQWVRGKIIKQLAPLTFQVEVDQGLHWRRHIDHLKHLPSAPFIRHGLDDNSNEEESQEDAPQVTTESTTDNEANTTPSVDDHRPTPTGIPPTASTPNRSERRYPVRNRRPPDSYSNVYVMWLL
uniref:Uncharacterized protein n=1 Tax=Amphimedon queenslandica TaxID=400682 RepID=A0A1X7VKD4_AMPQE